MSFLEELLIGERIAAVHADSQVTYLMLANGSQITIHGLVVVEPRSCPECANWVEKPN